MASDRLAAHMDDATDSLPRTDVDLESELESLREFIIKGPQILSHRLYVDVDEVESRFEHVIALLPKEVRRARRICRDEQRIVQDAKDEARRLLEEARAEAEQIVSEAREESEQTLQSARAEAERLVESSAIRQRALEQSEATIARAEETARQIREQSYAYAQQVVGNVVESLKGLTRKVEQDRAQLEAAPPDQPTQE